MNKLIKRIAILFTVILVAIGLLCIHNPLRLPESWVRYYLLNITPLSSSFSEVEKVINEHEWRVAYKSETTGYVQQTVRPSRIVGSKSIRVHLGVYQGLPFLASIDAFWGFDKDGKLIDIWVWKTWNGL